MLKNNFSNKQDKLKAIILKIESLKKEEKYDEAIKLIRESLTKNPDDYRLYEELADTYLYLGEYKHAEKAINYALKINSESATGNYLKGFLLLNKEEYKKAIEYLIKSNRLIGNNPEVLRNLGWAYTMNNEPLRGIIILRRALSILPGDRLISEDLAMALIGVGQIEEGNKILKEIGSQKLIKNIPKLT